MDVQAKIITQFIRDLSFENDTEFDVSKFKNRELPIRLSKEEEELHKDFVETLGPKAIWKKINSN